MVNKGLLSIGLQIGYDDLAQLPRPLLSLPTVVVPYAEVGQRSQVLLYAQYVVTNAAAFVFLTNGQGHFTHIEPYFHES